MNIGIIGAGLQGEACARILVKDKEVENVYLGDIDYNKINYCKNSINNNKLKTCIVDAKDYFSLIHFLEKCDICIDMLLPEFCTNVMKAALKVGINYINTAYDMPFWKNIVNGEELYLDKEFKERGLTALLGCGDSPGLVNIFVKKYCNKLDRVDSIVIKGIYKGKEISPLEVWNPGWSLKQAYIDFITPPYIYRDSKFIEKSPFDEMQKIYNQAYGTHYIALHSHEESYSLPYTIKGLKKCEFKYEVDNYAATLYSFGFNNTNEVKVNNDVTIKAKDFLFQMIKDIDSKKVNINNLDTEEEYISLLEISGTFEDKPQKYNIMLKPLYSNRSEVMAKFGTLKIDVALPCVIGTKCITNARKGIIFAEELDVENFIKTLNKYVKYEEILIEDNKE